MTRKNQFEPQPGIRSMSTAFFWGAFVFILATTPCLAFDGALGVGVDTGYSVLYLRQPADPLYTGGTKSEIHMLWGINDTWGINFAAGMGWYGDYTTISAFSALDEEGETITGWTKDPPVTDLRVQDLALSLVYAFDVFRFIPYASMGVGSARIVHRKANVEVVAHDVALRMSFGADVILAENFWLGAVADFDFYLTKVSAYSSQGTILLRATFVWNVDIFGSGANKS